MDIWKRMAPEVDKLIASDIENLASGGIENMTQYAYFTARVSVLRDVITLAEKAMNDEARERHKPPEEENF